MLLTNFVIFYETFFQWVQFAFVDYDERSVRELRCTKNARCRRAESTTQNDAVGKTSRNDVKKIHIRQTYN